MIQVLSGRERPEHQALFERLFRLRYDVFIAKRGWSLPSRHDLEIDQYDTDEAVYFVDQDQEGEIRAHVRLTPTVQSSLTADYFPHLFENGLSPRSSQVFEATRYMVLPRSRDRQTFRSTASKMLCAAVAWSLERKLTHLQTIIDAGALRSFVEMTLLTTPMGLSHPFGGGKGVPGGGECLAFRWPVTDALLNDLRAYGETEYEIKSRVA